MPNRKIRILYIASMNTDSGVACFLMNYVRRMDLTKFDLSFMTLQVREKNFHQELRELGCTVYEACGYKKHPIQWLKKVKRIIFSGNFDIIHANEAVMGLPALYYAWCAHVPVRIAHSHSTNMPTKLKRGIVLFCRPIFNLVSNYFFACSEAAGKFLFGKKVSVDCSLCLILNAINTKKYAFSQKKRDEIRKILSIENKLVLGHVGRFSAIKNQSFLIEIFELINKARTDTVLLLIGDGETRLTVEKTVQEKGLGDKIIFLGIREDVASFYSAMDIFLLPSICEGLGIVNIEAQASGLMCILSDAVPNEAVVLSSTIRLSLSNPMAWVRAVQQAGKNIETKNRPESQLFVKKSGYDIESAAELLQNKYKMLFNKSFK